MAIKELEKAEGKQVVVCTKCDIILSFEESDVKHNTRYPEWWTYISCPLCHNVIALADGLEFSDEKEELS